MVQESGFFPQLDAGRSDDLVTTRPAADLGPRYEVTYTLNGPEGPASVTQYVYPYAPDVVWTYMPPGQHFWTGEESSGGWYSAPASLRGMLIKAGLPTSLSRSTRPSTSESFPVLGIAAAFILLATSSAAILVRNRGRGSPENAQNAQ